MQKIIIITGTPGTGKTALANLIARKTNARQVNLGDLIKKKKLYRQFDRSRRSYVVNELRLRKTLITLFDGPKARDFVVETHWLGRFMPKRRGMVAIVVRCNPIVLARRLKARKWPKKKIWENVEAEFIDLSLYDSLKLLGKKRVYQVDATGKRPAHLAREASELLEGDHGWDGVSPNWLEKYDPVALSRKIL